MIRDHHEYFILLYVYIRVCGLVIYVVYFDCQCIIGDVLMSHKSSREVMSIIKTLQCYVIYYK